MQHRITTLVPTIVLGLFLQLSLLTSVQAAPKTRFYVNSDGMPLLSLINGTKTGGSIDIEIYTMENEKVQSALLAATQRGVEVRIVQEPSPYAQPSCNVFTPPASTDDQECLRTKKFRDSITALGAKYVPFNTQALCPPATDKVSGCFEHGKLAVFNDSVALLSTGNFDDTNLCATGPNGRCNRDYTVVTDNPAAVQTYLKIFENDLLGKPYDLKSMLTPQVSKSLTVSPYSLNPLLNFIASAKKTILIQNQYITDFDLNDALVAAASRGVKVFVNVGSACYFRDDQKNPDKWERTKKITTAIFSKYDAAGIQSSLFTRAIKIKNHQGYLHAKAIVVDSAAAWVGSVNGSTMALTRNREFGIFLYDKPNVDKLARQITRDFEDKNAETWQQSLQCLKD